MDLHFCSRCGISIPQVEIESGSAGGSDGKYFCSEHRADAAVAVAESPRPQPSATAGGALAIDPELLFCANCRVSIPIDDARSGRAHREFGSLLCAGCSKADPGERAARREAVEAEMAADVEAQDPVVAKRCSVCSAVVPYGQIVTGKAKIEGNQVVCERCRAVAVGRPASEGASSFPTGLVVGIILVAAAMVLGFLGMKAWMEHNRNAAAATRDSGAEVAAMRSDMTRRFADYEARIAELTHREDDPASIEERRRADSEIANLRQTIAELRDQHAKSDAELQQRIVRVEGQLLTLTEMLRGLAARGGQEGPVVSAPPAATPAVGTPATKEEPPATAKPAGPAPVNPEVVKLCKDLLESSDEGTRFDAARKLGDISDPAAIPTLVKAVGDDKHYYVRRACAIALAKMKAWLAVPALIKTLEDREPFVALAANNALQKITGNDFGVNENTPAGQRKIKAQSAEKWWEKNRDHPLEGVSLHPITD